MDRHKLRQLLQGVQDGQVGVSDAMSALRDFPVAQLDGVTVDTHRALRRGFPEVVLGLGKPPAQLAAVAGKLIELGSTFLITRTTAAQVEALQEAFPTAPWTLHAPSTLLSCRLSPVVPVGMGTVGVIAAGSSDLPVAVEAAVTAELMGNDVLQITDVGVAGLHRLLGRLDELRSCTALVVVAGMEGALPSVVAGLVSVPVVAAPTSVGYGASFGGVTALLGMLSACAAGVTVVNIDNGFGAGYAAALMNRQRRGPAPEGGP